ncbi:hypothetical protein CCAND93_120025 [Capnocytophaga canis]|uniref:Uncharacterized protein n=1 Tax=Capnocytophaga canis TaxID=1848903 RepID=A0A0B7IFH3_9FLAO|nr:hypothetical protein CCAND93_120025 [Capnocytophaga canis]
MNTNKNYTVLSRLLKYKDSKKRKNFLRKAKLSLQGLSSPIHRRP